MLLLLGGRPAAAEAARPPFVPVVAGKSVHHHPGSEVFSSNMNVLKLFDFLPYFCFIIFLHLNFYIIFSLLS